MKFCLLTSGKGAKPTAEQAEFVFFAHRVEDLRDPEKRFSLSAKDIELLNPNTRTCPIFRSKHAAEVSESVGGKDGAPFQYIITTTTAPPENLQPYIRKEFASIPPEKLLFKKRLTPLQGELGE